MQLNLFDSDNSEHILKKVQNGAYLYVPHFFSLKESDFFYHTLLKSIQWEQKEMNMYGKKVLFPRLTAWYGDEGKSYTYSGLSFYPHTWTKELLQIKHKIETVTTERFNSVLLNLYRDGNDSISWHADDEKELGKNPTIASVNFGAIRKFQLRHIETKEKVVFNLAHGSLLIMQGELQHYWQHQVPKTKKKIGNRINLTYRAIK